MDEYALNVLKLVASELRLLNGMTAAREMYGKSYFSLGIGGENRRRSSCPGYGQRQLSRRDARVFRGSGDQVFSPEVRWVGSYLNRLGWSAQALQMCSSGVSPLRVLRRLAKL